MPARPRSDFAAFLADRPAVLRKGPIALILAEDQVALVRDFLAQPKP